MADQSPFQLHSFKFSEPGDEAAYQRLQESGKVELFAIGMSTDDLDLLIVKLGPVVFPMHTAVAEKLAEALRNGLEKLAELKAEKGGG